MVCGVWCISGILASSELTLKGLKSSSLKHTLMKLSRYSKFCLRILLITTGSGGTKMILGKKGPSVNSSPP